MFVDLQAKSSKYPEIDIRTINHFVKDFQEVCNQQNNGPEVKIDMAQVEIAFMSVTRNDDRTNRSICRGEF